MIKSFGVTRVVFSYLEQIETLRLQSVDRWFYRTAVGRVQTRVKVKPVEFDHLFFDPETPDRILLYMSPS